MWNPPSKKARRNEHQVLDAGSWQLRFIRLDDRFGHELVLPSGDVVLSSVEGYKNDDWPPSPPLQELSFQRVGDTQVALLVGMAGASHWSLSIELRYSAASQVAGLSFDVACRTAAAAPQLASTYKWPPAAALQADNQSLARSLLVSLPRAKARVRVCDEQTDLLVSSAAIRCFPRAQCSPEPLTVRWRYTIDFESPESITAHHT